MALGEDENKYRIRTNVLDDSDKYIRMKLEHDFDRLDILSLSISQQQAYERFCSDYGAIVGRVVVNRGFGIPNARVAIFVPISDEDKEDEVISSLYPYENIRDTDSNGIRYNLLPKNRQSECHTPVGTMPSKREILDNNTMLEVYEKYYKYSTVTNASGDFMLFGVPVGQHILHMDTDLSDIGFLSRRPYHFIQEGRNPNEFDSPTKFKETTNLDNAIQIESSNKGVNVRPFWGDTDNCEVGITRVDFIISHEFKSYAMFTGSLFGDSEKNSVNKNCRPRSNMGEICEQQTTEGTIEMIRKTVDGRVEEFNVQGGRVVDENGTWSYLIPLNQDVMVTDEFGNMIPSEDPSIGIPTKTKARFKVSMDVTGDEGRVRKRAKYLVPHNPDEPEDRDFSFDETTSDEHFKDLYWNKIYTVSNHIPRYQGNRGFIIANNRNFVGIKDVDACPASNNPFPYNKLNPRANPLFNLLCSILFLIVTIMATINATVIPIINVIIPVVNAIIKVIEAIIDVIKTLCDIKIDFGDPVGSVQITPSCEDLGSNIDTIDPVECLTIPCEGKEYAPGCIEDNDCGSGIPTGYCAAGEPNNSFSDALNCLEATLAEELEIYQFDFYNDWINGSLYHFLFKQKRKSGSNGEKLKFCAYNCNRYNDSFVQEDGFDTSGSASYNDCKNNNLMVDLCDEEGLATPENVSRKDFEDGAVMYKEGEFFYPPILHGSRHKMFATDIINLGSMLDCDPDGVPFVFNQLKPTTYKRPPLIDEFDEDGDLDTSGMDDFFFQVSCLIPGGIITNKVRYCTNLRRQCELGVGLDEQDIDGTEPDGCVNADDMENDLLDRDVITYYAFNDDNDAFSGPLDTDISDNTCDFYFSNWGSNEDDYREYRGLERIGELANFERSYYFYFGLKAGNSAYEKTLNKFFDDCDPPPEDRLIISGNTTNVSNFGASDGSIDITILNGQGDYDYSWTGPNNFTSTDTDSNGEGGDISGLEPGFYTVNVIDSTGSKGTATFQITGPAPITCFSNVKTQPTHINATDGELEIIINNGNPDYNIEVETTGGTQVCSTGTSETSFVCTGLSADTYVYFVEDSTSSSNGGPQECSGTTTITAPPELDFSGETTDVTCEPDDDGSIVLEPEGTAPFSTTATTSSGYYNENGLSFSNLEGDPNPPQPGCLDYEVTMEDATGQKKTKIFSICEPAELLFNTTSSEDAFCNGLNDGSISVDWQGGRYPYDILLDGNTEASGFGSSHDEQYNINNLGAGGYEVEIVDKSACTISETFNIQEPQPLSITNFEIVDNDWNIEVTVEGGNPDSPINQDGHYFRLSKCGCSGSTNGDSGCQSLTNSGDDDFVYGTDSTSILFDTFNTNNYDDNEIDNLEDEIVVSCSPDEISGYSEVLRLEITDGRVYDKYKDGSGNLNIDCSDPEAPCIKKRYFMITNKEDTFGNLIPDEIVNAEDVDSNFDGNC